MKNIITNLLLISGILLILSSCESMLSDVDVPESDPKLVVTGFLSPDDDTISIIVKKSRPLYVPTQAWENSFPPINNATVTISDGLNSLVLPFNTQTGKYQVPNASMPVIAGNSYSLEVTTPEGYRVTSICTIPEGIAPDIEITGIDTINQYGSNSIKVSLRFRDLPGAGHFYCITAGTFYGNEGYGFYFSETGFDRGEPFVSDKNKDEELFSYRTWEIYNDNSMERILYVSLMITDENYYHYHRSVNSTSDGDNPFAEPTPVFTNIQGGLGIFSGINGKMTVFNLDDLKQHTELL
ncbi:MAG: DUF4249 domain-containing protein [Bacteroidota bacterium]